MLYLVRILVVSTLLGSAAVAAPAADSLIARKDGAVAYLGVVPAEIVRGYPAGHPEREMHGGAVSGASHVMVALFDEQTGERLTGLEVDARITSGSGFDVQKRLEPMVIAGSETYGNYFDLVPPGQYRIAVHFRMPQGERDSRVQFTWRAGGR